MRLFPALRRRWLLAVSLAGVACGSYLAPPRPASGQAPGATGGQPVASVAAIQPGGMRLNAGGLPAALWTAPTTRKLLPQAQPPAGSAQAGGLSLSACRGEREHCQLALRPRQQLRTLQVTVSDLQGPGRIPAGACVVRHVGLVPVARALAPGGRAGLLPDPLLTAPALPLPAGRTHVVWITVQVPADAPAGDYTGSVTVEAEGSRAQVPLHLHVYDFALPPQATLSTLARVSYGDRDRAALLADLRTHRMTGTNTIGPLPVRREGEEVVVDFTEYDRAAAEYFGYGFRLLHVPNLMLGGGHGYGRQGDIWLGSKVGTPEFDRLMGSYCRQVVAHFRSRGWLPYLRFQPWDEPNGPEMMTAVRQIAGAIKRAAPEAIIYLTTAPTPELEGLIDVWDASLPGAYDPRAVEREQAAGRQVWGYYNALYSLDVDDSSLRLRCFPWMLKRAGLTGTEWWGVNRWPGDPFRQPNQAYVRQHGGGFFLYPEPGGRGVLDSLRWEMYAAGLDDHDYLSLLQERVDACARSLSVEGRFSGTDIAQAFAGMATPGMGRFAATPESLEVLRDQVARLVEWYGREPAVVFDYRDGRLRGAASSGVGLQVNGRNVRLGAGGSFDVAAPLPATISAGTGSQVKTVRLELWPG